LFSATFLFLLTLLPGAAVLGGVVSLGLAEALAPGAAQAITLSDPVFGDVQVGRCRLYPVETCLQSTWFQLAGLICAG
jgi:hypothetical protein